MQVDIFVCLKGLFPMDSKHKHHTIAYVAKMTFFILCKSLLIPNFLAQSVILIYWLPAIGIASSIERVETV